VRGERLPDGGYRQDVTYELSAVDASHPIFEGLPPRFEIEDEVYLFDVFEDSIEPLLRSSYPAVSENFYSLALAVKGRMSSREGWSRRPGSDIVGWTRRALNSPLVYIQAGHGPTAYANRNYRQLLYNSIKWTIAQCPPRA
jgi:type 1 glutamine amidotransferase